MTELAKARAKLKAAREELLRVVDEEVAANGGRPVREESEAFRKANRAVLEAERNVPWIYR